MKISIFLDYLIESIKVGRKTKLLLGLVYINNKFREIFNTDNKKYKILYSICRNIIALVDRLDDLIDKRKDIERIKAYMNKIEDKIKTIKNLDAEIYKAFLRAAIIAYKTQLNEIKNNIEKWDEILYGKAGIFAEAISYALCKAADGSNCAELSTALKYVGYSLQVADDLKDLEKDISNRNFNLYLIFRDIRKLYLLGVYYLLKGNKILKKVPYYGQIKDIITTSHTILLNAYQGALSRRLLHKGVYS